LEIIKKKQNMKKYFYSNDNKKNGPYSFEELKNENIKKETLIWFEGLDDWTKAENVLEIKEILELSPPQIIPSELNTNNESESNHSKIEEEETDRQNIQLSNNPKPNMFREIFLFKGRIRRMEYGLSLIIYFIYYFIVALITVTVNATQLMLLFLLPGLIFFWAQGAKRCHDLGNSGWFQLIPLYGFWMLFQDGKKGNNKYGINPKGR
jgi:uncharacterized membrane protein YhaH (DUF805 family)